MKKQGIYILTCRPTGLSYIGKSVDINSRLRGHFKDKSGCLYITRAIKKYGKDAFDVEVIEYPDIEPEDLGYIEKWYITKYNTKSPNGYNLTDGGEGTCGYSHTEETRQLQSEAAKKRFEDPEARQRQAEGLRKANKAYWENNPEARQRHSEAMRKHYEAPEARQRVSEAAKKRWMNPKARHQHAEKRKAYYENNPEACRRMSEIASEGNRRNWKNPEYRQRQIERSSKQSRAYWKNNPEARQQQSERGIKFFEERLGYSVEELILTIDFYLGKGWTQKKIAYRLGICEPDNRQIRQNSA